MRCNKILVGLFLIIALSFGLAHADTTQTLTFMWDQNDLQYLDHWELYWSDVSGDYTGGPVATIPYDGTTDVSRSSTQTLTMVGHPGQTITKYFVLHAISTGGIKSDPSNEAIYTVDIPISAPFSFSVVVTITPAP